MAAVNEGSPTLAAQNGSSQAPRAAEKRGLLLWIALYKIIKASLTLCAGIATLHLRHRDLTEMALHLVHRLNIAPDSRTATWLLVRALHINDRQLGILGAGLFLYAALYFIEGIGLYREKRWAEWLTAVSSCLLLPLEIYELYHRPNWFKVGLLVTNVAVVFYLLWRIDREQRAERNRTFAAPAMANRPLKQGPMNPEP